MSKYDIKFVEHRNMAGGFWVSVFSVVTLEDDGSGQEVPNQFWVSVDSEYLQVWDTPINPFDYFLVRPEKPCAPLDMFELQYCYVDYIAEMNPEFNYVSYDDPIVFLDDDLEGLHRCNTLYLACWYRHKFEMNKHGYC